MISSRFLLSIANLFLKHTFVSDLQEKWGILDQCCLRLVHLEIQKRQRSRSWKSEENLIERIDVK
jgi:hypothetical protein